VKASPAAREAGPWLAVLAGWGLAFSLSCRLSMVVPPAAEDGGVLGLLLGGSRSALSANLYNQAETFFHRGVTHREQRALTNDWIQVCRESIMPTSHHHTEGGDVAEILPWLHWATQVDPHNVEATLVTAFWINTGLQNPRLARQILLAAVKENPSDYRILMEMGRLAIQQGQFAEAQTRLSAALAFWPSSLPPTDQQALLDKAEALILLGFLHDMNGHSPEAVAFFKNALAIFPERSYIIQRVECLESGKPPPDSAQERLQSLVKRTLKDACNEAEPDHDEDHEEANPARSTIR
jgi:tetratricopeptide (TPR) repeat protein